MPPTSALNDALFCTITVELREKPPGPVSTRLKASMVAPDVSFNFRPSEPALSSLGNGASEPLPELHAAAAKVRANAETPRERRMITARTVQCVRQD